MPKNLYQINDKRVNEEEKKLSHNAPGMQENEYNQGSTSDKKNNLMHNGQNEMSLE